MIGTSTGVDPKLTVKVFTKTSDEAGDGDDSSTSTALEATATGQADQEWVAESLTPGLEDLCRYKFTFAKNDGNSDFVLFRMLAPVWFDAVSA